MTSDNIADEVHALRQSIDELTIAHLKTATTTTRKDHDLDSIEVGTAAKGGGAKIYFNHRVDNLADIEIKLEDMLKAAKMAALLEGPERPK